MTIGSLSLLGVGKAAVAAGGFVPTDLAGLLIWLKADSLVLSDEDSVSTWTDSSGNSHDMTQSSTARPTYQTNELNSLPIVRFDGVNDYLYNASSAWVRSDSTRTVIGVIKRNTGTAEACWFDAGNAYAGTFSNGDLKYYSVNGVTLGGCDISSFAIVTCVQNGTNVDAYRNGSSFGSDNTLNNSVGADSGFGIGSIATGAALFLDCDIAEMLIYDSNLSDTDRGYVESYLATKYAL